MLQRLIKLLIRRPELLLLSPFDHALVCRGSELSLECPHNMQKAPAGEKYFRRYENIENLRLRFPPRKIEKTEYSPPQHIQKPNTRNPQLRSGEEVTV